MHINWDSKKEKKDWKKIPLVAIVKMEQNGPFWIFLQKIQQLLFEEGKIKLLHCSID